MANSLSLELIESYRQTILNNDQSKISMNAAIHNDIVKLAMDWEEFRKIDHTFSNVITDEMKATNQKSSGRCWGFAGLNLFRVYLSRKHNLKNFQFSQNYFMFFDKLEKSNYFLESIIKTSSENWNSRLMMHLLNDPIQDGGQWDMWVNLIDKYGVVPQTEMPESFQSSSSRRMNTMVTRKLREFAIKIRELVNNGLNPEEIKSNKEIMMGDIYKLLSIHLGTPPKVFDWKIRDKKNKLFSEKNLTPLKFYKKHVGLNLSDYICLINCPMSDKEYNKVYTVDFLGNVVEGNPIKYLNVESSVMKEAAIKSIKENNPVWFGCDVGKYFNRELGIMDDKLFNFELFYGTKFNLTKKDRLEYGESQMTHAMLFTGVDLDSDGKSEKWRVENSWGIINGDKGYHIMSDTWFDKFNYEVVVEKKYLSDDLIKLFNEEKPISLSPWDPMGALAMSSKDK
jgi:bleomycin hydrolase